MSTFARRLDALEKQIGRCPVCRDEPAFTILAELDDMPGEFEVTREDLPCAVCGSPRRMTIRLVFDDVAPAGDAKTKGRSNGVGGAAYRRRTRTRWSGSTPQPHRHYSMDTHFEPGAQSSGANNAPLLPRPSAVPLRGAGAAHSRPLAAD